MENAKSYCIIGDVHGCYATLLALLAKLPKGCDPVFVGDLVDRGESSRQVVDLVMRMNYKCVRGNHEQMMIDAQGGLQKAMPMYLDWLANGGISTLSSYMDPSGGFMETTYNEHIEWMKSLPLYMEFPDVKNAQGRSLLVTHSSASGVWHWNTARRNQMKDVFEKAVMWSRLKHIHDIPGVYNVFGHSPQQDARVSQIYANVDTGCVYKDEDLKLKPRELTALEFPSMSLHKQENIDKRSFYF